MNRLRLIWLLPLLLLPAGCGNGEGGGIALGSLAGTGGGTGGIGGTANGVFIYVTNRGSNNVSGYTINALTGGLTLIPGSSLSNIPAPSALAITSNGLFAYVANGTANTVTAFRISTDGTFLLVAPTGTSPNPVTVGAEPRALAISPDTAHLYVLNSGADSVTAFNIDASGGLSRITDTVGHSNPVLVDGTTPAAIAIAPNGKFLYVANTQSQDITVFSIAIDGLLTLVPGSGAMANPISTRGRGPKGLAVSPNGAFLYVANSDSHDVTAFQIETNGLLTLVGGMANPTSVAGTNPNALIIARSGQFLYSANGGGTVTAFAVGNNGAIALLPNAGGIPNPVPAGTGPVSITASPDGKFVYVANQGGGISAYSIAGESGTLAPLNPLIRNFFPTGTTPSAIAVSGPP